MPNNENNASAAGTGVQQPHSDENATAHIARVSVKIPPFWHAKPALWITQIESQFIAAGIVNDKTKYHTVVAAIESSVLSQISDIVLNPPSENMYEALKTRLLTQYADSEQKRIKKLLQDLELGDMRPSQLLREMQDLAGNEMNENMLKSVWMNRLPSNVRSIISISSEQLNKLALLADKVMEVSDVQQVCSITTPANSATPESTLEKQINMLAKEISELKSHMQPRPRSRSRSRTSHNGDDLCWFHRKFGDKARKCRQPCRNSKN